MKLRATLVLFVAAAVAASLDAPAAQAGSAALERAASPPLPHLAGTLPDVEGRILDALRAANLADPVVRIAADTNGHLTVAGLWFTYSGRAPNPLPALQVCVWSLLRAVLAAASTVDEVHLSGFHQGGGPFDGNRRDVTFSAAAARREIEGISAVTPARTALAMLPRIWYHPVLLQAAAQESGMPEAMVHPPLQHEKPPAFRGTPQEQVKESRHRSTGLTAGGIVEGKIYRGDPARRLLALTFDDGPVPIYTTLLLDTLERLGLQGTFFLIGQRVQQYPYFARETVRRGHEVGNHTFHHLNLTRLSPDQVAEEISRAQDVIAAVTGQMPRYFRPPGGDYNATVLRVATNLGLVTVFWTDDPGDYARPTPALLEGKLLARVSNGGILLLHQGIDETIRILPLVVEILRRRGFILTTVGELVKP